MSARKTIDNWEHTWEVQSYCAGEGWSTEHTETTRREALRVLHEYQTNAPGLPYRVQLVREPIALSLDPGDRTGAFRND